MLILTVLEMGTPPRDRKDALEELFREHYRSVLGFFGRRGCSPEEREDLTQETFLRAYRAFDGFRGEAEASTWLLTIATNLWRNRLRDAGAGKRLGAEVSVDDWQVPAPGELPQEQLIASERRRRLRSAIDELPPRMRRCVLYRVYQDRSYREIADLLGVTEATAKSQVSRARARLRAKLVADYPELEADADEGSR